jgi:hypothetical protein
VENGRRILAEYADALSPTWSEVLVVLDDSSKRDVAAKARAVHAFRSRILVSGALQIAEQLSILEDAVRDERHEDTVRIASVIGPLVDDLATAARIKALTSD